MILRSIQIQFWKPYTATAEQLNRICVFLKLPHTNLTQDKALLCPYLFLNPFSRKILPPQMQHSILLTAELKRFSWNENHRFGWGTNAVVVCSVNHRNTKWKALCARICSLLLQKLVDVQISLQDFRGLFIVIPSRIIGIHSFMTTAQKQLA